MQPARWMRAFADGAEARGVRIFEHSPVAAPLGERDGAAFVLQTPRGRIRAERVVVAADGALPILVPAARPNVRTKRLHMVATAPTDARLAQQLVYSRWGYEYHHQTPEGRVALGGYSDIDGDGSADSYTEREEPSPVGHGAPRAAPARGARRRGADHASLGGPRRLRPGRAPARGARAG